VEHKHLKRLDRIWKDTPIFFITNCTFKRKNLLDRKEISEILISEWREAKDRHGWAIGSYVIMPDHIHFFCCPTSKAISLSNYIGIWKQWTSKRISRELGAVSAVVDRGNHGPGSTTPATGRKLGTVAAIAGRGQSRPDIFPQPIWQRGFFDHLLRSEESYEEKRDYVLNNPVRAGLVEKSKDWNYWGYIDFL
jgi:REP element-mobilizing transposase RayT